jgi:hypothetical protein
MDGSYEMVPSNILAPLSSVSSPSVGVTGNVINALTIYNNLVAVTNDLTRVGTWTYIRTYNDNGSVTTQRQANGKALYTSAYKKTITNPANADVASGKTIKVSSLNQLFANLLSAWNATAKYVNNKRVDLCHSNCHSNCHSDCHSNSTCYK